MSTIHVQNICKTYRKGQTTAVNDASFDVEPNELFGLIGPDGAGKTTLFRILTTLLVADAGSASILGLDVVKDYKQIRRQIGYMPGRFSLYPDLSVEENLNFFAAVFQTTVRENYSLIRDIYVQIEPYKTRRAGKLSGGMKQKLALCCALIHKPKVLFLDEPTTGVDAVSRKEFWEMLQRLKLQGLTILVSTAYMDEATLCDRIGLIQSGKIMSIDTPANVIRSFKGKLYAAKSGNLPTLLAAIRSFPGTQSCYAFGESLHITFHAAEDSIAELISFLKERGHENVTLKPQTPTVEDCFIELMS